MRRERTGDCTNFAKVSTFLPNGRLVVLTTSKNLLYLLDPTTGKHSKVGAILENSERLLDLVPSEGDTVVAARMSWETESVNLTTGKRQRGVFADGPVKPPVGRDFLGGGIYDGPQPALAARLTPGGRGGAGKLVYHLMAVGWPPGASKVTLLVGFNKGDNDPEYGMIWAVTLSPSGRLAAVGMQDGMVIVAELATGKRIATIRATTKEVNALAFSPCGQYLAVGEIGKKLAITDKETSEVLLWDLTSFLGELPRVSTPALRERRWSELISDDTRAAYRALAALSQAPEADALALAHLRPLDANSARVTGLIRDLDSDTYATREAARRSLEALGQAAGSFLRKALAAKPSLEAKKKLTELVHRLDSPNAWGRDGRALDLLERRGTKEACRVLDAIAKDEPGGWFAVEAREALGRLTGRGLYKPKMD